ncbi:hypothetical protein D3C71_1417220 [compost metagenome]
MNIGTLPAGNSGSGACSSGNTIPSLTRSSAVTMRSGCNSAPSHDRSMPAKMWSALMVFSSMAWPCCCGQPGMSLARMSRANTLLPQTLDKASLRARALPLLPSHCSDGTVTLFSIKAASAWLLNGVSVTLTPATSPP